MWNIGDNNAKFKGKEETNFHINKQISDDFSSLYRGNLGDNLQNMSGGMIPQHKSQVANAPQGIQNMFTDKSLQFAKPNVVRSQYGSYQFGDPHSFSTSLQTKGVNFQKSGLNNLESVSCRTESSCQSSTSVGDFSQLSSSQHSTYGSFSQAEARKFPLYAGEGAGSREKLQADFNPKDVISLTVRNFLPPNNSSFGPTNASYRSEKPSAFSHSGMGKIEVGAHEANSDGRNFDVGTSTEALKGGYNMDVAGIPNVSLNMMVPAQTSAAFERNQAYGSHHFPKLEIQSSRYPWGNVGSSFHVKDQEKCESGMPEKPSDYARLNRSSIEVHASKRADGSDRGNENNSLKGEASQEIGATVSKTAAACESQPSLVVDSISNLSSVNVAPTTSEKLWDGTLQLNTSTVVSAVAVFKSGEKVSEVNWSRCVEVKGKVRLEAFEKFVQELPRSRTRALMVISIYWKVGSSETGLKGMKEVAKGYKDGQRVGYAQICPGIDLYVCPRSEAIITILAKYGFFKGMAAVEDDQDSLIGCVVWRRNYLSSDFASKKPEKKDFPSAEQPLDSPKSAISNNADQNSLIKNTVDSGCNQVRQGFKETAAASGSVKPSAPEKKNIDVVKNMEPRVVPTNVTSNTNNAAPVSTPVPANVSSVIPQLPISVQKTDTSPDLIKCTSDATTLLGHDAAQKKSGVSFETSLEILSGAPQKLADNHRNSADNDDDDLPEFDFGNAYGIPQLLDSRLPLSSHNHHPLELPPHDQKLPVEVSKSASAPMPSELASVRTMPPNDAPHRPYAMHFFGLTQNANQGVTLPKDVGLGVPVCMSQPAGQTIEPSSKLARSETDKASVSPAAMSLLASKSVETAGPSGTSGAQNSASQAAKSSFVQRRPIWDDDDDMPEWCPPDLENGQPPPPSSVLSPLLRPSPPALQPMLPTTSGYSMSSHFPAAALASAPSRPSVPPPSASPVQWQYDQNISHQHQSLSRRLLENNPKIPTQTRPATRFGRMDWRSSPEPNQTKRQRVSGWDVKPWEVKPDPWCG
uniref:Spen paralogue and orthologue SPOC C-terminal domain-containing protein n=1 Tax=Anthurium amnicola TaxID=1678845 RepID=A0A1D1ZCY0_9ARAE